ncbi:hypothetical protein RI129_010324 [Pyrocoelia pectoralis]|uniref:Uncharacterized protein n=1 Tax=Pyrocoelia pectoralis TaxID=417401 RepID=A0AAN7ZFN9_9COLE
MMLERSIRMGDYELFLYILPIINNLYFSFNYYNYARWLPYYHQLLINVETTHPGLLSELKGGRFGIRRTQKSFARQPIDLVLDQMVNRDAGRTMSGITYLTNSASARMRWSTDRCIISAVTNNLFNMVGLNKTNDITNDLSNSRKKKNLESINNLSTAINNRMNPFDESLDKDWLFNISTGKAAPREVSDYLLSVEKIGKEKKEKFITDCSDDVTQFDVLPIKHVAVKNFTSAIKKKRIVIKTTVEVLNAQTNMFGQLLRIALDTKNVDMEKVLTFPLFEVPLSLCHIDGTIHKTDKSVLTKQLELSLEEHLPPPTTDIKVFDGFAIFHSMTDVPKQFGDISKSFLSIICNSPANEIHVIFDTYKSPSIKNTEHERRDAYSIQYHQMRPDNFERELRNSYFKTNLVQFLICHWGTNDVKEIIGDKTVYINHELCFKIKVEEGNVTATMCDELTCASHEEANTKIVYHICKIQKENANVVVRSSDTDVLIIMLTNMCHCATTLNIWMDFGSGNNRRFINISGIHDSIGDEACRGLAGLHAFTGSDVTPSFYRKGKTKPLKMYLNNKDFQLAFTNMAVDQENSFSVIERFTCSMYGLKNASSVNECRFFMFLKATENKNRDAVLDCASNLDAYLFPPSQSELRQQFLRASYVNSIWSNAHQKNPTLLTPEGNGWILENGNYVFQWFIGDMAPADIAEIFVEEDDVNGGEVANNIDTEDDEDESLKLPSNVFDDDDGDESDNSSYDIDSDFQMEVE